MKPPFTEPSRVVRLRARPPGLPRAEHFEIAPVWLPDPEVGQVIVRNRFFRVSASLRMMVSAGAEAVEGVPIPALAPGDVLAGEAVGEVITAGGGDLEPGDLVLHHEGFREHAVIAASRCVHVGDELPSPVAYLSHGGTAYAALTRAAKLARGETVFVSGAAGAIGSMTAMVAKALGAGRVVGSTRSERKAEQLRGLGYDAVIVQRTGAAPEHAAKQLKAAAPDGLDVAIDNVGGELLGAALFAARRGARLIVLGALAGQLALEGTGRAAPVTLDSFPLLLRGVTIRGYSADEDPDARLEWYRLFGKALRSGAMTFPHVVLHGIQSTPGAIQAAAEGAHLGAIVVAL